MFGKGKDSSTPPSRRVDAMSRCSCGRLVTEGTAHTCGSVDTKSFENPAVRPNRPRSG